MKLYATQSRFAARALCGQMGLDLARLEGQRWAEGSRTELIGDSDLPGVDEITGCYSERLDAIICETSDERCLEHEYAHPREGLRH